VGVRLGARLHDAEPPQVTYQVYAKEIANPGAHQ
jgi:hypothetical protein